MKDGLSFLATAIVSAILLFAIPLQASEERRDQLAYMMAFRALTAFADDVCVKGEISAPMYRDFEDRLALSGMHFEVEMKHRQIRYLLAGEELKEIEEDYYSPQILAVLFKAGSTATKGVYTMQAGDSFEVVIRSDDAEFLIPYGGLIRHENH